MTVLYQGHRDHTADARVVLRIDETAGPAALLDPCFDVRNHSPTGFEWGYGGSGPAQLALALAIDALDGDVRRARRIYQYVKWTLVAHLDREDWTLTRAEVVATIERLETDNGFPHHVEETCAIHGTTHRAGEICPLCLDEEGAPLCQICHAAIDVGELCGNCAVGNDPFGDPS